MPAHEVNGPSLFDLLQIIAMQNIIKLGIKENTTLH